MALALASVVFVYRPVHPDLPLERGIHHAGSQGFVVEVHHAPAVEKQGLVEYRTAHPDHAHVSGF
jgi:hypothetical protein